MIRNVLLITILLSAPLANAKKPEIDQKTLGRIHVCHLSPFMDDYIDIGVTERIARDKTARQCQDKHGESSMFCRAAEAKCKKVSLL